MTAACVAGLAVRCAVLVRTVSGMRRSHSRSLAFSLAFSTTPPPRRRLACRPRSLVRAAASRRPRQDENGASTTAPKDDLLALIAAVPRNRATPRVETQVLLDAVRRLEATCPTADADVLTASAGPWELVWTAQDDRTDGTTLFTMRWVNPLENQAYSNNPRGAGAGGSSGSGSSSRGSTGRANPLLPLPVQEWLTKRGLLLTSDDETATSSTRTSTQTIDLKNRRVLNSVSLPLRGGAKPLSLTVRVDFVPHGPDRRRINVKFQSFQVTGRRLQLNLPLGPLGPTGWLRTTYIDESLRVTRGHKGSVFVLRRRG
jgi:hypothetical protein